MLQNIATTLKKNLKKDDLIGRWGGEEFIGIFTIGNDYEGTIIADKLRGLIENTEINHGKDQLHVTLSLGVTTATIHDTADSIVARADQLMYESKKQGKNRVTSG